MAPTFLVDRPLVVVQHHDHALRLVSDVVERLVGDPAGKRRVPCQRHHVLRSASLVACHCHSQRRRQRRARVSRAIAVVRTLRPQHETIEPAGSTDGMKLLSSACEQFVHVRLVADVK